MRDKLMGLAFVLAMMAIVALGVACVATANGARASVIPVVQK